MDRGVAREKIMRVIFQMDAHGTFDYRNLEIIEEDKKILKNKRALKIFDLIKEHHNDIDKQIKKYSTGWSFDRISRTDLAILRTAVCEILYVEEIPKPVSINEAVEIAKKYGNDKSYSFINAVLREVGDNIE